MGSLFTSTLAKMRAVSAIPGSRSLMTGGTEVLEMQMNMILVLADAAAFTDLDGHRPADHVARRQVLGIRGVAFHETLARRVGQIATLAARAFGDETTRAVNPGGMELHEFHVLQRQPGAQRHAAAVARAGVRRRAREPGASVPAGGQDGLMRPEAVQRPIRHVERDDAAALAVLHDQVESEVLDEKTRLMFERLLV